MRSFIGYELLWMFLIYSFLGWVLETAIAIVKQRKIVNRGLINGPFCIIYGIGAVLISVGLQELSGGWLFFFATIYASVVEWTAGHIIQKVYHERWWDYSNIKFNLDGYICLPFSLLWGVFGYVIVRWGNHLLFDLYKLLPSLLLYILVLVITGALCVDMLASYILIRGKGDKLEQWEAANSKFSSVSLWLAKQIDYRIHKAYPKAVKTKKPIKIETVFAQGCSFYKIVLLFILGSFLGDITETIFCRITAGVWMSRSSLVWGPFSIVWGFAIAAVTALLYKYRNRSDSFLFIVGTLLGGAYEYLCSVAAEVVFGKVFWDYSDIPFNLGGRINLLYCFFWGIAAVVWFKILYPISSKWIEKIAIKPGKIITWVLIVFMVCNMAVSSLALIRYDERSKGVKSTSSWQSIMDAHYDDAKMAKIYPNAKKVN